MAIPPPPPRPARDMQFPPVRTTTLGSGMALDVVELHTLPVLYLRLVVDTRGVPVAERIAGLRRAAGRMLREGSERRSSAEIADAIEFVGGDMGVDLQHDNITLTYRVLKDHLAGAIELLAEVVRAPSYPEDELEKYKRREIDRLNVAQGDPHWLAGCTFYREIYGQHPYGVVDVTAEATRALARPNVQGFHRQRFVGDSAFLVVVGDVEAGRVAELAERSFGDWGRGSVAPAVHPPPKTRTQREIFLVDRPSSVQSVIYLGNLALRRADDEYIALRVSNQILGGSASSRLFLDLREKRSLTYGAYSRVEEFADVSPFRANASVRNEVTGEAVGAFFENFERWRSEAASVEEMTNAQTFLTGVIPLYMETPGSIAQMVATQRTLGLPSDYWSTYRGRIAAVTREEALDAARRFVRPDEMAVVVVGRAAAVAKSLEPYGPVRMIQPSPAG